MTNTGLMLKGDLRASLGALSAMLLAISASARAQTLCVFDVMGAQGDSYAFMKDDALASRA